MKLLKSKWCILLFSTLLSVSAMAAEVGSTYNSTLSSANQGDAISQYNLGVMYALGQGVRQDYQKAVEWFTKAANQGDASAQYNIGVMYAQGKGVRQDYQKAFEWFTKAANQGHAKAQHSLGFMYYEGKGVRQDYRKAKDWFGLSCDNGDQLGCDVYKKLNQRGF